MHEHVASCTNRFVSHTARRQDDDFVPVRENMQDEVGTLFSFSTCMSMHVAVTRIRWSPHNLIELLQALPYQQHISPSCSAIGDAKLGRDADASTEWQYRKQCRQSHGKGSSTGAKGTSQFHQDPCNKRVRKGAQLLRFCYAPNGLRKCSLCAAEQTEAHSESCGMRSNRCSCS